MIERFAEKDPLCGRGICWATAGHEGTCAQAMGAVEVVRVRCPHRIGLAYREDDGLSLLPCDCNEPSEVLDVVARMVTSSGLNVCSCASGRGVRDCPQHADDPTYRPEGQ